MSAEVVDARRAVGGAQRSLRELRSASAALVKGNPALRGDERWQRVCRAVSDLGDRLSLASAALAPEPEREAPDPDELRELAREGMWA